MRIVDPPISGATKREKNTVCLDFDLGTISAGDDEQCLTGCRNVITSTLYQFSYQPGNDLRFRDSQQQGALKYAVINLSD
jgi:hypothetical protein